MHSVKDLRLYEELSSGMACHSNVFVTGQAGLLPAASQLVFRTMNALNWAFKWPSFDITSIAGAWYQLYVAMPQFVTAKAR